MPELPDIETYLAALRPRIVDRTLERVRAVGPSLLRSYDPPVSAAEGKAVLGLRRLGKRIVVELEEDLFLVIHLMVAGRIRWRDRGAKVPAKVGLGALDFPNGTLLITEAGSKRRASLHLVRGEGALAEHDPGGLEVLGSKPSDFRDALLSESRTLKRALTDPRRFSGVGNAYSDEILHRAGLSPVQLTSRVSEEEVERLHRATQEVLREWVERLGEQAGDGFPEKVTAFRPEMAVHGKFGQPCPVCGAPVQRIVYADNETNYCARCQTGGKVLADRALSRLLKEDFPRAL
ncbi:MAG: Fpg/Nei family DNA glycosylase [Acidimicrobiia bacterium]